MDAKTLVFSIEPAGMYGYVFLMDKYNQGDKYVKTNKQKILDSKYQTNTNFREIFQKDKYIQRFYQTTHKYFIYGDWIEISTYRA